MVLNLRKSRFFYVLMTLLYIFLLSSTIDEVCIYFQAVPGHSCFTGWHNIYYFFYILVIFISIFIPIFEKKPSTLILNFLFLFCFIPSLIYFPKQIEDNYLSLVLYSLYMFFSFCFLIFASYFRINVKSIKLSSNFFDYFIIVICVLFILIIVNNYGFSFTVPNITDVYGVRESYKENSTSLSSYAVILGGYVISPLIILLAVIYKRLIMLYLGLPLAFTLIYVIFSSSGIKSIAFSSIAIIFFYYLFKRVNHIGYILLLVFNLIFLLNILVYKYIWNDSIIFLHWLRRVVVAPGSTSSKFLEYFYINENPIIGNAPLFISEYYFNISGSANTGFFVEGVGRFGWYGLIINTLLLGVCLIFLNYLSDKVNKNLLICLLVMVSYAICNTSFMTVLFSYGLLLIILLGYLLTNYEESSER